MKKVSFVPKLLLIAGLALPFGAQVRAMDEPLVSTKTKVVFGMGVCATLLCVWGAIKAKKKVDEKAQNVKEKIEKAKTAGKRAVVGAVLGCAVGYLASFHPIVGRFVGCKTGVALGAMTCASPDAVWSGITMLFRKKKEE